MAEGTAERTGVRQDRHQTELLQKAWAESGKVYGYRKLHDDLVEQGESICPNRVSRLAQLAGIRAQIGYRRRPGSYGGKPSVVVVNTLDRKFDVEAPGQGLGERYHLHPDARGVRLPRGGHRPVFPARGRLVDAKQADDRCRPAGPTHGRLAAQAEGKGADPLRSASSPAWAGLRSCAPTILSIQ